MFKKISLFLLVVVIAASFAHAATPTASNAKSSKATVAKSTAPNAMSSSKSSMTAEKVEGTVQKIDTKTHTITVQVGSDNKDYTYSTKTWFMNGKKRVKSTDLKVGDRVSFSAGSKNYVKKFEILPATK